MKEVTFEVSVGKGDIVVNVEVSDEEYEILKHYCRIAHDYMSDEECEEFSDVEELSDLYNRVIEASYDNIAEYSYEDDEFLEALCNGERDWETVRAAVEEKYELYIDWPELEDEDDDENNGDEDDEKEDEEDKTK